MSRKETLYFLLTAVIPRPENVFEGKWWLTTHCLKQEEGTRISNYTEIMQKAFFLLLHFT